MPALPSGLPDQIDADEDIVRFLTQSNQFSRVALKPAAFLPNPKDRETSLSRHGLEPRETLWSLGALAAGSRTLYGAALFKAINVQDAGLSLAADEPPDRHAVIRGWPWHDDPDLQKAKQKEHALILVGAAGEPLLR